LGSLSTPESVQKLQKALHAKAKAEAGYRFYALYDKISREDILAHAYALCRSNRGAPGVDRQDFADVEEYGVKRWLGELALALKEESYRPAPIRRVFIPKANGKLRPLGISTLRDRVCMTAAMLVLEPVFEADLPPEQYAYRPGRNAQQAVVEVEDLLFRGHPEVVDADLADYFGSIPHADLLKSVARRIVDRRVLHLIKMWLECAAKSRRWICCLRSPRRRRHLARTAMQVRTARSVTFAPSAAERGAPSRFARLHRHETKAGKRRPS
jgi:RNA-directed DNA polymerase